MQKNHKKIDVVVIGAGPAGIGASLVFKKEGIDFVLIEASAPGGKVNIAPRVDNYPNYHEIPGPDLAMELYKRLTDAKIEISGEKVISLIKEKEVFTIETDQNIYTAKAVLVASGAEEKKLGLPNEERLFGRGVSYCAICDGHFYRGKTAAIIGGGNSALKEGVYLAKIVKKLYVIHRRNEFRGLPKTLEELKAIPSVEILTPYIPLEIIGDDTLKQLKIQNKDTGEIKILDVDGLFPLVGQNPNTDFIKIPGVIDDYRFIPVDNKTMMSNVVGLYAAGDVLPRVIKQIYLSEHDGIVASKSIINYLNNR